MIQEFVEWLFAGTVETIKHDVLAERDRLWKEYTGQDLTTLIAKKEQELKLANARMEAKTRGLR